jgi:NO-binding membrane sensor protein with MHYT domain
MGIGIWSMHYIRMLAFSLPVPVLYDWPTVLWSLLADLCRRSIVSSKHIGWASGAGRRVFL